MTTPKHRGYQPNIFDRLASGPHSSVSFQSSLWHATAAPAPETQTLEGDATADIVIVGGGFLGCSTALHLAEAGHDVVILEADEPGFGASGRNTGFVVPNLLTGLDPRFMKDNLGEDAGERLCRMLGEGAELTFDLIERHGIECEARQAGWLQPIHAASKKEWLTDRVAQWQALGRPVRQLSAEEVAEETGTDQYHGAFLDPTGGHLNPLGYVRGLARAAINAGVRLFTNSRVEGLEREGTGWRVRTEKGTASAPRVMLTTNVSGNGLAPKAEGTQFPITLFQCATQPLDPELRKTVLPHDRCCVDTRKEIIAFRWTPDHRLVTGGLMASPFGSADRAPDYHLSRLRALVPALPELRAEFAWQGRLGAARDFLPRIMELGDGAWSAIACNGRGMAMTTALGRAMARWLHGGSNEGPPVPVTAPDPMLLPGLAPLALSAWLPWNRLTDRREVQGE